MIDLPAMNKPLASFLFALEDSGLAHAIDVEQKFPNLHSIRIEHKNGNELRGYIEILQHGFQLYMPLHDRNLFSADIDILVERLSECDL